MGTSNSVRGLGDGNFTRRPKRDRRRKSKGVSTGDRSKDKEYNLYLITLDHD